MTKSQNKILLFFVFLLLNFSGLAIGGLFTGNGVTSEWYLSINKAPWTPPGWVFGFAWTSIMICFAFYLSAAWNRVSNKKLLLTLYSIQWILNVAWNPLFFYLQNVLTALFCILSLTLIVGLFLFKYREVLKAYSLLLLPYFVWMIIATSLNAYIFLMNG